MVGTPVVATAAAVGLGAIAVAKFRQRHPGAIARGARRAGRTARWVGRQLTRPGLTKSAAMVAGFVAGMPGGPLGALGGASIGLGLEGMAREGVTAAANRLRAPSPRHGRAQTVPRRRVQQNRHRRQRAPRNFRDQARRAAGAPRRAFTNARESRRTSTRATLNQLRQQLMQQGQGIAGLNQVIAQQGNEIARLRAELGGVRGQQQPQGRYAAPNQPPLTPRQNQGPAARGPGNGPTARGTARVPNGQRSHAAAERNGQAGGPGQGRRGQGPRPGPQQAPVR